MRKTLITTILALAGLTIGTAHAAPSLNLLNRDGHGHLTLNGVPMGVPVSSFHECKGDPTTATTPCVLTTPEIDGYGFAQVFGLPAVKDGVGRPVFSGANVTTHHGVIDGVHLVFADDRYVPLFRTATNETVGEPDFTDHNGVMEWHGALHRVYLVLVPEGEGAAFGVVQEDSTP
ncbi:TPA: hypothetical protein QDB15_000037 [Burkholderia vietnamiensis]|uniref:Uncharacterized protein n=1 Tax=Pandoraea apista TaxID=93218 RepID=A0A5E5P3R6_9BURK|nr:MULTISPECIES: hypothetical protein [Burkholderiaceae]MCA8206311.1 hypothetical protein [Burkholderia vietnamiensis]VVG70419.1 hypothetical protein PAP18089_01379 [Pandoraea apista]HDR8943109.1 hypothetical protein [Burkholderia vietnamiensis]HDR9116313.1 hypothetical protein [Burkholderia vietnamiensis]HDR9205359.1 hypothetical protein [Burkholderia vietnamiensis]